LILSKQSTFANSVKQLLIHLAFYSSYLATNDWVTKPIFFQVL